MTESESLSGETDVLIERGVAPGVAVVTLNRPDSANSLNQSMHAQLSLAWKELQQDASIRSAILTGAGERAFCGGRDLKELKLALTGGVKVGRDDPADPTFRSRGYVPRDYSMPVVVALNGYAVGGGLSLALSGDVILAVEGTFLADKHIDAGQFGGLGWILDRFPPAIAAELVFSGSRLPVARAYQIGVINRVVPRNRLLPEAVALAECMAAKPSELLATYKRMVWVRSEDRRSPAESELFTSTAANVRESKASSDRVKSFAGTWPGDSSSSSAGPTPQ